MPSPTTLSPGEVADETTTSITALSMIVLQFFPFAVPALLLVVAPLALLAAVAALLAAPIVLPIWLIRRARRTRSNRRAAAETASFLGTRRQLRPN